MGPLIMRKMYVSTLQVVDHGIQNTLTDSEHLIQPLAIS